MYKVRVYLRGRRIGVVFVGCGGGGDGGGGGGT